MEKGLSKPIQTEKAYLYRILIDGKKNDRIVSYELGHLIKLTCLAKKEPEYSSKKVSREIKLIEYDNDGEIVRVVKRRIAKLKEYILKGDYGVYKETLLIEYIFE